MTGDTLSSTALSAHRTRSNVRPAAVRVETLGDSVEIIEDAASADTQTVAFATV
jgi:hypothetical protein